LRHPSAFERNVIALTRPDGKTAWFRPEGILGVELLLGDEEAAPEASFPA